MSLRTLCQPHQACPHPLHPEALVLGEEGVRVVWGGVLPCLGNAVTQAGDPVINGSRNQSLVRHGHCCPVVRVAGA